MVKRALPVLVLSLLVAGAAMAQEYGRTSGGQIEGITKQPSQLSASLGATFSTFRGYEATLGGTLLKDRIWFFGSAFQQNGSAMPVIQQKTLERLTMGKAIAQVTPAQTLDVSAFADQTKFLTMHYTGIITSNMFVTATITQSKTT